MPAVQEQDEDLASAHSICSQIALPGVGLNEHCGADVH